MNQRLRSALVPVLIAAAWLSVIPGQILRLQPGGKSVGIVATDIVATVIAVVVIGLLSRDKALRKDPAVRLLLAFAAAATLSWIVMMFGYSRSQSVEAFAYLVRLLAYLASFVLALKADAKGISAYVRYGILTTLVLFGFGIFVLEYLPDFAPLAAQGWDPHVGRFTSTWLDPNYVGSFLAMAFATALSWEAAAWKRRSQWLWLVAFLAVCAVGIQLTVSRSALVTLAVAGLIVAARTSWRAAGLTVLVLVTIFAVPSRFQGRIATSVSFVGSGSSSTSSAAGTTTTSSADPTASARVDSWKRALTLAKSAPVFGVGYNFYEPATIKRGLIAETGETRGTSGSDSSLLTILATMGIVGLVTALAFFGYLGKVFLKAKGPWAVAGFGLLAGMFVGSAFNNLLLYPLALLPFMLALGIAYRRSR